MKKRILVLVALVALLVLGLTGAAMAAEDPISLKMELSATRFSGPAEVTVTIHVSNTTDEDMPGPLALYTPDGKIIEDFGTPTLAANESKTWNGVWTVTAEQIKDLARRIFDFEAISLSAVGQVRNKTEYKKLIKA